MPKGHCLKTTLTKEILEYSYNLHGSIAKTATALGVSDKAIQKYMQLYGIDYSAHYKGIYTCNHNTFAEENETAFYLAGFIAADGSVQYRKHSKILKIALSSKDTAHLDKIRILLQSNNPIHQYVVKPSKLVTKPGKCAELCIVSQLICNNLARFNIIPNKTPTYSMPQWLIEHKLVNHFLRGYIDGDGTYSYCGLGDGRTIKQLSFSVMGTYKCMEQFKQILINGCSINDVKIYPKDNVFVLAYSGNINLAQIANFLYKDATIFLDRKYNRIKHLLDV